MNDKPQILVHNANVLAKLNVIWNSNGNIRPAMMGANIFAITIDINKYKTLALYI